ncbi:MAG: DUF2946 family protein [Rhodomicrobium sp.]
MGVNGHRLAGGKRARRVTGRLRLIGRRGNAVSLFAALVLLLGTFIPSWHAAQEAAAQDFALAGLQALAGDGAGASGELICHHEDEDTPGVPAGNEAPVSKKSCPLCLALQHFSPAVAQRSLAFLPSVRQAVAAVIPHAGELKTARETEDHARPRAPPLA